MEAREDGNVDLLKEKCKQKSEGQNMSSHHCQAKEGPLTEFPKRRREWMRIGN